LVLAAAEGTPLQPVQLQKALFLIGQKLPDEVGADFYEFEPYHYGPFDARVYWDAEGLARDGLASIEVGRWKNYAATKAGMARAKALEVEQPRAAGYVKDLVRWVRSLPFNGLVKAIYAQFPAYRAKSVFRD
jgi:hypothetical protein